MSNARTYTKSVEKCERTHVCVLSVGAFWYLLPVNGQENPLVENTVSGSTVTIIIMRFKPCAPRIV
jgi:hypothetical protein